MKILVRDEILKKSDGALVEGYIYLRSYQVSPTKNGGSYVGGHVEVKGDMPFKAWGGSSAFEALTGGKCQGKICKVTGRVNEYGGVISLIFDTMVVLADGETSLTPSDFFKDKYDIEAWYSELYKLMKKNLSENAMKVFELVMSGEILERFKIEYAAINYHDNCKGGLLAHTTKVVKICSIIRMYPELRSRVSDDLLYLSAVFHDIGKIFEYRDGVIDKMGKAMAHPTIGCLMISNYQEEIQSLMGEEFYYNLLSAIAQHNGEEYGEAPRTIVAWVLNRFDLIDSELTLLNQNLKGKDSDATIAVGGLKLN